MKKSARESYFCLVAVLALLLNPAKIKAGMILQSLTGVVTATEISSFKTFMAGQPPPTTNTYDNNMADGSAGMNCEALGLMYEVTNDPAILNEMILYADAFISLRNDHTDMRVMWTGKVEPVWLTKPASSSEAGYAGCENNDIAGHIAYCAKLILQSEALWNATVPDGNPHGYGVTYFQRATNYIAQMEYSESEYFNPNFINQGNDQITAPTSSAWTAFGESVNAWNRQMMFLNGWQRLSECHQLLGDNPTNVSFYDAIVQASINWFFTASASGLTTYTTNGYPAYNWDYAPLSGGSEDMSLHADYDMWGLNRAYLSGRYTLSQTQMIPFGNTLQYVIYKGTNTFADWVSGDYIDGTRDYIYPAWTLVANFDPLDYFITSDANVAQGSQASNPIDDAFILWTKNARYLGAFANNTNSADYTVHAPWIQTVTAGGSATCSVTVRPLDGFSSSVTLGASGLPLGVTASFNPSTINSGSGTSMLTLSASNSTLSGTYSFGSLAVIASNGSIGRISPMTLVVSSGGDFAISASPSSQNVTNGGSANYTVTITNLNGFDGTVNLSASSLPSGATASFNPTAISGSSSSTLTITATNTLLAGTNLLTVTGTSGNLEHSVSVALVAPSGESTNLALNQTATASSTWSSSYIAADAIDGNPATRWSAASGQTINQWLMVDFGNDTFYDSVIIEEISYQRVTGFQIQSSTDGVNFTTLVTGTTIGPSLAVYFNPVYARYVRLYITSASGVPTINEFEVYSSGALPMFTLSAGAGANGLISPYGNVVVDETSNQTFTITPDSGYQVSTVTVDGVGAGAVTSYSFTNVQANHTISATFFLPDSSKPQPNITSVSLTGTNFVIGGTNGFSNATFYLLGATNLALPFNQWTPMATNVFDTNGNFIVTNPITSGGPGGFLLLRY
jgi:hypothetical protein